jgi:hypothetical protein
MRLMTSSELVAGSRAGSVVVLDVGPSDEYEPVIFLAAAEDQDAYLRAMTHALVPGGALIVGTFAPDGPDRCSGLPTHRYDANTLLDTISLALHVETVTTMHDEHVTPNGVKQPFTWVACRRRA